MNDPENQTNTEEASPSQVHLLYVLAGTRRLAANYAESEKALPSELRCVQSTKDLRGLERGNTLYVHKASAWNNRYRDEIIEMAISRDWQIEYV